MSLFGSREDDPLLENDPLAPSSEEESPEEKPGPPSDDAGSPNAPSPSEHSSAAVEEDPSASATADDASAENPHFRVEGSDQIRVIERSIAETAGGRLTVLNSAFDNGWRLVNIELREEQDEDRRLAFMLRRTDPPQSSVG